ncbi:MAG: hypothetical protein ACOX5Z_00300 [Desulfobulbus sp.]|jgi:hypothetical protein
MSATDWPPVPPGLPTTFTEAVLADPVCPECGRQLLCVYGGLFDYDTLYCPHPCCFEYQYPTSSSGGRQA